MRAGSTKGVWVGAYATGPTTGAIHSASSINPPGTTEQFGAVARVAGQLVSTKEYSLATLCANAEWSIKPPHNLIANTQTLTLSDRSELRIDPTTLISTGAIAGASGAQVYSAEAAAKSGRRGPPRRIHRPNVDRGFISGLPSLEFPGRPTRRPGATS